MWASRMTTQARQAVAHGCFLHKKGGSDCVGQMWMPSGGFAFKQQCIAEAHDALHLERYQRECWLAVLACGVTLHSHSPVPWLASEHSMIHSFRDCCDSGAEHTHRCRKHFSVAHQGYLKIDTPFRQGIRRTCFCPSRCWPRTHFRTPGIQPCDFLPCHLVICQCLMASLPSQAMLAGKKTYM